MDKLLLKYIFYQKVIPSLFLKLSSSAYTQIDIAYKLLQLSLNILHQFKKFYSFLDWGNLILVYYDSLSNDTKNSSIQKILLF